MFKHLSICAALLAFGTGSANAQQQEATLQTVAVPGATFDIMVATPKFASMFSDLSGSPDALVMHLVGGKLVLGFDSEEQMFQALDSLRRPIGAFHVASADGKSRVPAAIYILRKGE